MKKTVDKIIAYAVAVTQPEEIILFGSVANGKNNFNSDVDLLIVTDTSSLKKFFVKQIENFARELCLSADILVYSKNELESVSLDTSSFLAGILKYGKIVYKKTV